MTINFYLNKRGDGELGIYAYVRGVGGTITAHTGEYIDPKHWDIKKQVAKRSYTGSLELNSHLNSIRENIRKVHRVLSVDKSDFSFAEFRKAVRQIFEKEVPEQSTDRLFEALDKFIAVAGATKRELTIKKYKTLKAHLEGFRDYAKKKKYTLTFETINQEFYELFTSYLILELKHTNNTVGKYISTLKTFLNWASEHGFMQKRDFAKFKTPWQKVDIVTLTEEELLKIYNLELARGSKLDKVRDVFCFGCFTGQRFSDIESIRREDINIKNRLWRFTPIKTGRTSGVLEIPLNDYVLEILEKYKDKERPLPIISIQKTNDYLKDLGKLAKITEPITIVKFRGAERISNEPLPKYEFMTTHTARRTFVTLSLEKGMRPETVMEITGHADYKTFKKYIKITSKVKENEMREVWRK